MASELNLKDKHVLSRKHTNAAGFNSLLLRGLCQFTLVTPDHKIKAVLEMDVASFLVRIVPGAAGVGSGARRMEYLR